jgi:hypothetical protein
MQIDDWNRKATQALLADADRTLAISEAANTGRGREIERETIAGVQKNYIDLVRRGRPLIMSDGDQISLQRKLDRLRARLRFFGVSI